MSSADSPLAAERRLFAVPVFDRLPEYYRESSERLGALARLAEDLLAGLGLAAEGPLGGAGGLYLGAPDLLGTPGRLAEWLESRLGAAPQIWSGLHAVPQGAGGLVFARAQRPSAVLAWEDGRIDAGAVQLPAAGLPVGARVQAVLLARTPAGRGPLPGERTPGRIVWELDPLAGPGERG